MSKRQRLMLNCWLVSIWLWVSSMGGKNHRYLWMRASYSFKGRILHSGVSQGVAWRSMSVIEFIPPKHDFPSLRNFLLLFRGQYRVWRLRVEEVRRFDTEEEAAAFAKFGKAQNGRANSQS